ncbi:MAG: cobalamin biosynthesis protein [Ilumatobacteraceae bacterium]
MSRSTSVTVDGVAGSAGSSRAAGVVVGVGMSSRATATEVRSLVEAALRGRHLDLDDVTAIATRERFVRDPRLDLGRRVVGVDDHHLEAVSVPVERTVGLRARVAETAALTIASRGEGATLLGAVERSAHATVAIAATTGSEDPVLTRRVDG